MKFNVLTICDAGLALLLVAFCWAVGGAWLAVPAAGLALWAFRSRNIHRAPPEEQTEGLRRVRAQVKKDTQDPSGAAAASAFFDPK